MQKTILILLTLSLSSVASSFIWESDTNVSSVQDPMANISTLIETDMAKVIYTQKPIDLSHAVPPEVITPILPPEVKKPQLPHALKLSRSEFETVSAFNQRVYEASVKRDAELNTLQENYRLQVLQRNREVEKLSILYNEQIKERNTILERLQEIQKKDAEKLQVYYKSREPIALKKLDIFAASAVDKVFGKPKLSYVSYNPDSEIMHFNITSYDGKNFKKEIAIKIKPNKAKALKDEVSTVTPLVTFDIDVEDAGKVHFSIKEISLDFDSTTYVATDSTASYIFKPTYVTIDNAREFNATSSQLALQDTQTAFVLQNPNLNDRKYQLGAVALTEGGAIIGVNEQVVAVNALPKVKTDLHKWLFMIAIENYAEMDNVLYADRSATAVKAALQKRLGISKKNTYTLFDNKATSGAIKDKLRSMLARVKKGDSIYFYYSGHGVPSKSGEAYILPSDKVVDFIDDDPFFKLENIYARLSDSKAKHSFAFVDACFSGKTDNVPLFKGVAPGLIRVKKTPYDESKMTIITAGLDDEFSNMYEQKRYRLFSYYLAQALIEGVSDVSLLYKKVNVNVLERSRELGSRYEQSPQLYGNQKVRLF